MKNLFKAIFISLMFLGSFVGIARAVETFTDVQSFYRGTLTSSISSSATTINVSVAPYVNTGFLVIEPRTPNQEIVLMTSRSGTALTVVRGLSATSSIPVDAGYKRAHAAGSAVEMVDVHYYIKQLQTSKSFQYRGATTTSAELSGITGTSTNDLAYVTNEERFYRVVGGVWVKQGDNNETIGGTKTFSSEPQVPTPTASTSAANMGYVDTKIPLTYLDTDALLIANSDTRLATQKATKAYIDNAVVAGGVIANNTTTGIQRVASSTQIATGFSSTTAFAIPSSLASSTASSTTIVVATKASTGKIDPTFLNGSTETYTFNGTTTLATTTINGNLTINSFPLYGYFGDGSDGNVTIGAGTTTLTRDMYYDNLTITGTLVTDGYKIFARTSATGTGIVSWGTANNGANATFPGGAGGARSGNGILKNNKGGDGGNCGAGGASGSVTISGTGGDGGAGGNGGVGATGTSTATSSTRWFNFADLTILGADFSFASGTSPLSGGAGGSGGSGAGSCGGASGGGGGASGGPVFIASPIIGGTFTVRSIGGNGGTGTASGGGGGGGGSSIMIFINKLWNGTYLLTGGASSGGTNPGNAGSSGRSYELFLGGLLR